MRHPQAVFLLGRLLRRVADKRPDFETGRNRECTRRADYAPTSPDVSASPQTPDRRRRSPHVPREVAAPGIPAPCVGVLGHEEERPWGPVRGRLSLV